MAFFHGAVLQLQANNRVFTRETHVEVEVWQTHDLLVVDDGIIDLILAEGHTVTHLVQTVAVLLADFSLTLVAQLFFHHLGHLSTR